MTRLRSPRRPVDAQRPEPGEIAIPGTRGLLELHAVRDGDVIRHSGEYVYVGKVRDMHAFSPASCEEPVLFLGLGEVVSFRAVSGPPAGS